MSLPPTSPNVFLNDSQNETTTVVTTSSPPFQANPSLGLVVEAVVIVLICGHLLIITTLCRYRPWNIADLLLFSLSMADVINAAIPLQMLNIMNNFIGPYLWTRVSCAVFVILTYTFRIVSVCTITLISCDRAILLTRPLQHHIIVTTGRARKAVIAIWLFSLFMAILPFIGVGMPGYREGYCFYQLFDFGLVYGYIIESIGILQLIVVLICFIAIKVSSGKFVKRQSTMAAAKQTRTKIHQARESAGTRQVKQMTTMMAIVVVLYYISWLPYLLINLYSMVTGQINHSLVVIIGFFSLVNALINPVLYGKMSQRYRKGYFYIFKKILSFCGGERPDDSFFDDTRRNTSKMVFSKSRDSTYLSQLRKSVDFSSQEGGGVLRSTNEEVDAPFARKFDVRFDVNGEQTKIKDEENHNYNDLKLAHDSNASVGSVDTSSHRMLIPSEDETLQKTDHQDALLLDESFDSAL